MHNIQRIGLDCCGCGNCYLKCPKHAIQMKEDDEGFIYPVVNDDCIDCGVCLKICPQFNSILYVDSPSSIQRKSFITLTKNVEIKKYSSSGGVFGTIAYNFLKQPNAYICASMFVEGILRFVISQDVKTIRKFQGSKYVQSELGRVFIQLKEILVNPSNKVLFCGTPCQVAALYSFLNSRPLNLYTLDLICHGVPSRKFLDIDLCHYNKDISSFDDIRFRWRNPKKMLRSIYILVFKIKGKSKKYIYSASYDPYFATFMKGDSLRYSCYQCKYANMNRVGDITIGDCDTASHYPDFFDGESKSTVIINTKNGDLLWDTCKDLFYSAELNIEREASVNHQLSYPLMKPHSRGFIYKDLVEMPFEDFKKKYAAPSSNQQKLLFFIQKHIPSLYRYMIENK